MFRSSDKREKAGGTPNKLRIDGKPNELSWTATDAADSDSGFAEDVDSDNDEQDVEGEEQDPETAARRAALTEEEFQAELQREAEEYGLTNDDPTAMYGPNGEEVAIVLEALDEMGPRTAERLADAWYAVDQAEREVVERIIGRRHRQGSHQYELSAAEDAVSMWLAAKLPNDEDMGDGWREVAQAANDAITAIILDEELSDADYETLYGPWAQVMDTEGGASAEEAEESEEPAAADQAEGADEEVGEFGPNTELVVEFLTTLGNLEKKQIAEVVGIWREQPKEPLKTAHRNLQALADEDDTWREQLRLAQEEIFAWMDHKPTKYHDHSLAPTDDARGREVAGPAMADAAAALVMADILEPEDAEILYRPWAEVVGTPQLPAFEEGDEDDGESEAEDED